MERQPPFQVDSDYDLPVRSASNMNNAVTHRSSLRPLVVGRVDVSTLTLTGERDPIN